MFICYTLLFLVPRIAIVYSALFYTAIHHVQGQVTNAESISKLVLDSEPAQGFLAAYKCLQKTGSAFMDLGTVPANGTCTFSEGAWEITQEMGPRVPQ